VPLPADVPTEDAAFAAPAAIALHAIRLARAEPGSVVAVVGLGLIGQLAGRLLRASGCQAVGTDPRVDRRELVGEARDEEDVRWTEGRNIEAVLDLLAGAQLRVDDLITHRFPVDDGARAYETLHDDPAALGVLLEYAPSVERRRNLRSPSPLPRTGALRVGIV